MNRCANIIEEVEFLLYAQRVLRTKGPHFTIFHNLHVPGTLCAPGEEIGHVAVTGIRQSEIIPMSGKMLLLFDFLARNCHFPMLGIQIVRGIEHDAFCQQHGLNNPSHTQLPRKISLSELRVYFERIKSALERAFRKAGIFINPSAVLVKEETSSNRAVWRLKASIEWVHVDKGK